MTDHEGSVRNPTVLVACSTFPYCNDIHGVHQAKYSTKCPKLQGKGKQEKVGVSNKDVDSIHLEELESKIKENEVLHSKVRIFQ